MILEFPHKKFYNIELCWSRIFFQSEERGRKKKKKSSFFKDPVKLEWHQKVAKTEILAKDFGFFICQEFLHHSALTTSFDSVFQQLISSHLLSLFQTVEALYFLLPPSPLELEHGTALRTGPNSGLVVHKPNPP